MKYLFPGMDPYLEQFWLDVHARIILYACDQLEEQLPDRLIARVEERVVFEAEEEVQPRAAYPDVKITERSGRGGGVAVATMAATAEPIIVEMASEAATETCINIVEAGPGQRLITVIELLSSSNKYPGESQRQYLRKQADLKKNGVSLVEIDLLRNGQRIFMVPSDWVPARAKATYQICVHRGWEGDRFEVYPAPLRSPLPAIRIPLRQKDADIRLDLQAVVEQAYRKGRYHLTLQYDKPPVPPLDRDDAKWSRALVKKVGKNGKRPRT